MNIDFFAHIDFKNQKPEPGTILISEPFLFDQYFKRTVIYMVEHNKEGSVGFILNKPVNLMVSDVLSDFPTQDTEIFFGGPVNQNNLFYLHNYGEEIPDSRKVADGMYWGGDFDHIRNMFLTGAADVSRIRFFAGYSGWTKGQLSRELKQKSWIVAPGSADLVFNGREKSFWSNALKALGPKFEIISNFPEDPGLN